MLLLYQAGSVKIGEVVRYTVIYTPSHDRILPSPEFLYLRIKNTSAIALRAAFVHGPYNLNVAAYPETFRPNDKFNVRRYGAPEFEPMLKAGGTWSCHLVVPEDIRQSAGTGTSGLGCFGSGPQHDGESVSWIVEVASQVIFSSSAAVNYEILLARDEKSLSLRSGIPVVGNQAQVPQPGRVSDYQQSKGAKDGHHPAQQKGVFSRAIRVKIEDTASLWNTPPLPSFEESPGQNNAPGSTDIAVQPVQKGKKLEERDRVPGRQKRVHLVVLTHGLHSNLGADMLFLKESIDAGVKQAKLDAKARRAREKAEVQAKDSSDHADNNLDQVPTQEPAAESEEEDEQVIVRGFSGNATRTERGIKYLGKRLARYVLSMTYPDQPYLPAGKAASGVVAYAMRGDTNTQEENDSVGKPAHKHSTIHKASLSSLKSDVRNSGRGYRITKISFIGHSLGGLVQTYAIAYIQKHSPQFFDLIEPVNFITLASPLLGLNHENPMYVKFALDFGLVGRTGQDLGLTWRAPTIARSGWGAIGSYLGEGSHKKVMGESQTESKPLLRILPTGPAHIALKKFRNRTVYSNVVNDGIVPLRTSCLLFLDWQGLGRVEKARREAGLVETVVGFGWAELTGANVTAPKSGPWTSAAGSESPISTGRTTPTEENSHEVPQPSNDAILEDDRQSLRTVTNSYHEASGLQSTASANSTNPFSGFFSLFKNNDPPKPPSPRTPKQKKIYERSQTLRLEDSSSTTSASSQKSKVTSGQELGDDLENGVAAPPRTTLFESAGDLLNPKLPSVEYLVDPSKRPRTIFHDRIYHPSDIPPPPLKKRPTGSLAMKSFTRTASLSSVSKTDSGSSWPYPDRGIGHEDSMVSARDYDDTAHTNPDKDPLEVIDSANMTVEEKIARAYHRELSWRKVLVKLEPDAHNNMIVRRMFANAFGWPVVQHLVDAHFSDSAAARTRDDVEKNTERARDIAQPPDSHGRETKDAGRPRAKPLEADSAAEKGKDDSHQRPQLVEENRTESENREAEDHVSDLLGPSRRTSDERSLHNRPSPVARPPCDRLDSATWSDRDWASSADESDISEFLAYGGERSGPVGEDKTKPKPKSRNKMGLGVQVDGSRKPLESSSSPLEYWTEKIVGKGAGKKRQSPDGLRRGQTRAVASAPSVASTPGLDAPTTWSDDVD